MITTNKFVVDNVVGVETAKDQAKFDVKDAPKIKPTSIWEIFTKELKDNDIHTTPDSPEETMWSSIPQGVLIIFAVQLVFISL